jgi:hypothetical protein
LHNWFKELNAIDVTDHVKEKNGMRYLPWMWAWMKLKELYPLSYQTIYRTVDGSLVWRDPKGGHVDTSVTIVWFEDGVRNEHEERTTLPCMDFKNKAYEYDNIDSMVVNKTLQRCLTKCIGKLGLGAYLYVNEDLPEAVTKIEQLVEDIREIATKRAKLSDSAKDKVAVLCKKAEKEANPSLDDDLIRGDFNNINNVEILENLKKNLLAVRK